MTHSKKVRELYDKAYHLFNNHISNNGKLNYSDKEYGYLADELEDVEVGYFKDESVDSDYAQSLRDEGFTMTEQEAIDTLQHRIESIEEEIGPVQYANGGGIGEYAESKFDSSVAKLREYIRKYPYIWTKNGKEYIPIEGWQFAGLIMGYSSRVTEVNPTANGYMAKAEVIDSDGKVVCSGFGLVDKSETKWKDKPDYQLVGFAQTRAVSRALRNCLSWMVKAAGFSTTPAEEMYGIKPEKRTGKSKSTAHSTPSVPPVTPANDDYDFPFDNPEFDNPVAPVAPVAPAPSGGLNADEIEDTLRAMAAKARANRIVIKSEDFMAEIDNVLLGNNVDLQLSMLKNAVSYMDENNIILQSPRYMSKLSKVANQEPF